MGLLKKVNYSQITIKISKVHIDKDFLILKINNNIHKYLSNFEKLFQQ